MALGRDRSRDGTRRRRDARDGAVLPLADGARAARTGGRENRGPRASDVAGEASARRIAEVEKAAGGHGSASDPDRFASARKGSRLGQTPRPAERVGKTSRGTRCGSEETAAGSTRD